MAHASIGRASVMLEYRHRVTANVTGVDRCVGCARKVGIGAMGLPLGRRAKGRGKGRRRRSLR